MLLRLVGESSSTKSRRSRRWGCPPAGRYWVGVPAEVIVAEAEAEQAGADPTDNQLPAVAVIKSEHVSKKRGEARTDLSTRAFFAYRAA